MSLLAKKFREIKYKPVWIGLIFLSLVSFLYIATPPRPSSPTPLSGISPTPPSLGPLSLLNVQPPSGRQPLTFPQTSITALFNRPVSLEEVSIKVTPSISHQIIQDSNTQFIYFYPQKPWVLETPYTVTISTSSGQELISYSLVFYEPTSDEFIEEIGDPEADYH